MAASTTSFSLSSTPPPDTEIWGYNLGSRTGSSPAVREGDPPLRRRNGGSTPRLTSSASTPALPDQDPRSESSSASSGSNSGSGSGSGSVPPLGSGIKSKSKPTSHPLAQVGPTPPTHHVDVLGDISRPSLHRLTSETERQVAESSRSGSEYTGSMRGSLDLLRMSAVDEQSSPGEVEVLIHTIKPNQSLAGIALLYGIDLATLRKVNKLWTSDPIHLRTHLYVPLEACRWNKASEVLMRGPGEGQVTLYPKSKARDGGGGVLANGRIGGKGKEKEVQQEDDMPNGGRQAPLDPILNHDQSKNGTIDISNDNNPWFLTATKSTSATTDLIEESHSYPTDLSHTSSAQTHQESLSRNRSRSTSAAAQFLPSTNLAYDTSTSQSHSQIPPDLLGSSLGASESSSSASISESSLEPTPRVLDVVRIPSSQLRFFPKRKPPDHVTHVESPIDGSSPTYPRAINTVDQDGRDRKGDSIDENERRSSLSARSAGANRRNSTLENTYESAFGDGPSIVNDLSTLPRPLRGYDHTHDVDGPGSPSRASVKTRAKTTVVRLRPPQPTAPSTSSNTFANRLSSLFTVPPPPPLPATSATHLKGRIPSSISSPAIGMGIPPSTAPNGRPTAANSRTTSRSSTPTLKGREESMELVPRLNDLRVDLGSFGVHFGKGGLGISFPSASTHSSSAGLSPDPTSHRDSGTGHSVASFGSPRPASNGLRNKEGAKRKED
ncbi:hypothetical protein IAU59_007276 [Kwoniella sp. CBS 9459]